MSDSGGLAAGTDPRVVRTRGRLRAALLAACAEQPLDAVSVADVVRRAGVGRATFYLHYEDLDRLAVDACAEIVRAAVDALHASDTWDPADPPPALGELLASVADHAGLYRGLLRPGGGGPLGEVLHRELAARCRSERHRRGLAGDAEDLVATAVAATFTGVLAGWLHDQVPGTPGKIARQVWRLLSALHRVF
jgi:AcrR family transcriptional regulator